MLFKKKNILYIVSDIHLGLIKWAALFPKQCGSAKYLFIFKNFRFRLMYNDAFKFINRTRTLID
jgi:hypothetical protein